MLYSQRQRLAKPWAAATVANSSVYGPGRLRLQELVPESAIYRLGKAVLPR
jgi:hypothetical protein